MTDMNHQPPIQKPKTVQAAPKRKVYVPQESADVTEEEIRELKKDPFFKMMMDGGPTRKELKEDPNLFYIRIGRVNIPVPKTWKADLVVANKIGNDKYEDFIINGDKEAKLSFYYRGRRCDEESGRQFVKALKAPPHVLTEEEYNALQEIARIDRFFTKRSARTESINGRHVLVVEGTQDLGKPEQVEIKTVYIDSDGTGTSVQEVYFLAKPNKYKEHLAEVNKAINAIIWN